MVPAIFLIYKNNSRALSSRSAVGCSTELVRREFISRVDKVEGDVDDMMIVASALKQQYHKEEECC